jgi:hypothetical protein
MMATIHEPEQALMDDMHALLERTLIEAYLEGKGYTIEGLKGLPPEQAKQLMREASTYASSKLADLEGRAHFVRELHEASSIG